VDIPREVGCTAPMVKLMVREGRFTPGLPDQWDPQPECLGIAEREVFPAGIPAGVSLTLRSTAREGPSTISREVAANGGHRGLPRGASASAC
jgi:hypothetical protein